MAKSANTIAAYVEAGAKRTGVGALDWPGWWRNARDEDSALQTFIDYCPRYARVLQAAGIDFPVTPESFTVEISERLPGNSSTDYGIPDVATAGDAQPMDEATLVWSQNILKACWQAFDAAMEAAQGKTLRLGPRGGGRDLERMLSHVTDAERSYVSRLGWRWEQPAAEDLAERTQQVREGALKALAAAAHGELPTRGPRGGALWTPRYFVRRTAWHVLDHVWEIEDRTM